jgi:hypothetical protein
MIVLAFVAVGIAAAPPALTFTYHDVIGSKAATETDSYAINNDGVITGDFIDGRGIQHAMVLRKRQLTPFKYGKCVRLAGTGGPAGFGINTAGTVAGWCTSHSGIAIGWTWSSAGFVDVNVPKALGTEATGINDNGDVVGLYFDSTGLQHGFLKKSGGKYQTIDVKNASSTAAWGINNSGVITVQATNSNGLLDGYTYDGTKFKKVNVPGANQSIIHGNNSKGDIVYTYADSAGAQHGALRRLGVFYQLDDPNGDGASGTRADGINDWHVIVGRYSPSDGSNHGFKAVPVKN